MPDLPDARGARHPFDARGAQELPPRPQVRPTVHERVRSWLEWVGPGRVVATAVVVLAVLAAAYWLVKPPPTTTESTLPYARSGSTSTTWSGSPTTLLVRLY